MPNSDLRPLTKSRFKIGHECTRKLYYKNRAEYEDLGLQNEFLKALAEGGFQVGALVNLMHSPGQKVTHRSYESALNQTSEILTLNSSVTIFEAAVGDLSHFVRVDILKKYDNEYEIIEVKSKSIDPSLGNSQFWVSRGARAIHSEWREYLLDIAFQVWVARKHLPQINGKAPRVTPYLMLLDKASVATVDGLNQKFELVYSADGSCSSAPISGLTLADIGESVMISMDVSNEVDFLLAQRYDDLDFETHVSELTAISVRGVKPDPPCDSRCKSCEFRVPPEKLPEGKKSGFAECWREHTGNTENQFDAPMVFDLYQNRNSDRQIQSRKYFVNQLEEADLLNARGGENSYTPRQRIQIEYTRRNMRDAWRNEATFDAARSLEYPLHFIDFETCMAGLPFLKGQRPYQQTAFQFSHHKVEADGSFSHATEFLNTEPGVFPNFEFVRALKRALGNSGGTVLRFSDYENTVLNQIRAQLRSTSVAHCSDRNELIEWIEMLSTPGRQNAGEWVPNRAFVDIMEWIEEGFFYPSMNGSVSIKKVLPAILEWSPVLERKYSSPIYGRGCGSAGGIESRNFKPTPWVQRGPDGRIFDPYKNLPPLFEDFNSEQDRIFNCEILKDGAAAMTAYQRLQFTTMSERERQAINSALLRYCELDTLAMVMIWEALVKEP